MELVWALVLAILVFFLVLWVSTLGDRCQGVDHHGVIAYMNRNDESPHYVSGVYTGLKWQCVEYARRWLLIKKKITFESVKDASDIWDLDTATQASTGQSIPFHSATTGVPPVGALLIYAKTETLPHGHVSVVVGVTKDEIQLAEQNWTDDVWRSNYARTIPIQNGSLVMTPEIIGWKYVVERVI